MSARGRLLKLLASETEDVLEVAETVLRELLTGQPLRAVRAAERGAMAISAIVAMRSPKPRLPRGLTPGRPPSVIRKGR